MKKAIGILELNNISRGILAADTMLKAGNVELIDATPVCPGKYLILASGDVGAVQAAVDSAGMACNGNVIDKCVIPNLHESIFPALSGTSQVLRLSAVGMVETYSAASAIVAADAIAKAARVTLLEVRLARGMGGKALVLFTGDVGSVKAAVTAGASLTEKAGLLVDTLLIPAPHKDLLSKLV